MIFPLLAFSAVLAAAAAPSAYPAPRSDPRFELFGVVQLLAGAEKRYSGFHRNDVPYTRAAQAWFGPFAAHPVVEVYERLAVKGIDNIFFHGYLVSLGEPPELEPRRPFEFANLSDAGGAQALEEFRFLLADFARVSRFDAFYKETASPRAAMNDEVARQAVALDAKARLERYTGLPVRQRYALIVSAYAEPVLGSTWATEEGGERVLTSVYGPEEVSGKVAFRLPTRLGSLWTEILVDQLGPAASRHRVRINHSKALYGPLGAACAVDWYDCVQRHAAFAAATRLLDLSGEHESAREWPVKYARIGLPYIGALADRLKEYEADRKRYPTLMDFYPRLLDALEERARAGGEAIPFQGGVRAVLASPAPRVLILPGAPALRAQAKAHWPEAVLMSDEEALAADLKGHTLIALGTVAGNRWLARHWDALQLPLALEASSVSFEPRPGETSRLSFQGKIGLITTAVNPVDPGMGLLLYTAGEAASLPAVAGAYEGPADFVVLDGGQVVKQGRYEKTRRPWRLQ